MLTSAASDGEYTAPIRMNADDQQHAAAVHPQPMPEYTLPIKKEMRDVPTPRDDMSDTCTDDYLKPITIRPEPVGANDVQEASGLEGSSVKNAGFRPQSVMVESNVSGDTEDYINAEAASSHDALLQETN